MQHMYHIFLYIALYIFETVTKVV